MVLRPSNPVPGRNPRTHYMGPIKDRKTERSRTLPGIGLAKAKQWGDQLTKHYGLQTNPV